MKGMSTLLRRCAAAKGPRQVRRRCSATDAWGLAPCSVRMGRNRPAPYTSLSPAGTDRSLLMCRSPSAAHWHASCGPVAPKGEWRHVPRYGLPDPQPDADFVAEMTAMLKARGCAVYVATSRREAERIEAEADVEMVVRGPVFRPVGDDA